MGQPYIFYITIKRNIKSIIDPTTNGRFLANQGH